MADARAWVPTAGLVAGPSLFLLILVAPWGGLDPSAQRMLAALTWVAAWWVTEAVPLGAAALLPLVLLPLLGILGPADTAASYAQPAIFLFLGGFLLARAFEDAGLHRRVALGVLARTGTSPRRVLLGVMLATALMSMWVSNTATALIMLPVAAGIATQMGASRDREGGGFATVLVLGVAYAASLGGIATIIGTPPNALLAGQLPGMTFGKWMLVGVPVAAVTLALAWAYLAFFVWRRDDTPVAFDAHGALSALGPMSFRERTVLVVFMLTVFGWVFRADLDLGGVIIPGWADTLGLPVNDAGVAITAAIALFTLPDGKGGRMLTWASAVRIPWEVLILFGGGFALAAGFQAAKLDGPLLAVLAPVSGLALPLVLLALCALVIAASEIASNTALAALLLPALAAAAPALGATPVLLMVAATLAASCGFMLPVATPPNAVAYSTGHVSARQMARAGFTLDVICLLVVVGAAWALAERVLGVA